MGFESAGADLIRRLEHGLYEAGKTVMRESILECPVSGPDTYVAQVRTVGRGPGRRLVFLGDDPEMVGDNGTLRRSGRVFPPVRGANDATVTVGYGFGVERNPAGRVAAEYAVPVHERSEVQHQPPTKSHFLLDPLLRFQTHMAETVAAHAKTEPGGVMAVVEGRDLGAGG